MPSLDLSYKPLGQASQPGEPSAAQPSGHAGSSKSLGGAVRKNNHGHNRAPESDRAQDPCPSTFSSAGHILAHVTTFTERFEWIYEHRKLTANGLCERAGVARSYLRNLAASEAAGRKVRPGADVLDKLARAADVSEPWLRTGQGNPGHYEEGGGGSASADPTPPTPPTRSGPRLSVAAQRPEVEVLGWFFETLQSLVGQRKYTAGQSHAATQFLLSYSTKLPPEGPRKIVLGALEAAKELDELGNEMTPEAILQVLLEKNAPPSGAEAGARQHKEALEFTKDFIRKESKKALKGGYVPKKRGPQ